MAFTQGVNKMKFSVRTRALVLAVSAGTLLTAPMATSASAALKPSVVCSKLVSTTTIVGKNGTTASTFLTCTPAGLSAGGSSKVTVPASQLAGSLTSTITWNGGKGTTVATEKYTPQKTTGKCPAGTKYLTLVSGTTKASTGAAAKIIKSGEPISGSICTKLVGGKFVTTLLTGTKFSL
jgi:hypothetical protein